MRAQPVGEALRSRPLFMVPRDGAWTERRGWSAADRPPWAIVLPWGSGSGSCADRGRTTRVGTTLRAAAHLSPAAGARACPLTLLTPVIAATAHTPAPPPTHPPHRQDARRQGLRACPGRRPGARPSRAASRPSDPRPHFRPHSRPRSRDGSGARSGAAAGAAPAPATSVVPAVVPPAGDADPWAVPARTDAKREPALPSWSAFGTDFPRSPDQRTPVREGRGRRARGRAGPARR